jgi:type IV pilus assembly protein PilX
MTAMTRGPGCVRHQRGAALVIGLILLLILTILAVSGMGTTATELFMAGNEQSRKNAAHAAATGIEEAIGALGAVGTTNGAVAKVGLTPVPGADPSATWVDKYQTTTRYVGTEWGLPQSSVNKFVGIHYTIQSTGTSTRNASDLQTQGVLVVAPAGGPDSNVAKVFKGLGP